MKSLHPSVLSTKSHATNSKNTTPALSPLAMAIRLSVLGVGLAHCAANAATIEVDTNRDNGNSCSLREAILSINNGSVGTTGCVSSGTFGINDGITFSNNLEQSATIILESGALVINNDVSIDASDISTGIRVDGNNTSSVFEIDNATVSIDRMTITGGSAAVRGGGIYASSSTISLRNSALSGNSARSGAGISADSSTISLSNSTVSNNQAVVNGGGIFATSSSTISLSNSTVSNNQAVVNGGGISADSSTISLSNNTVSGNQTDTYGGGIFASGSTVSLSNSTLSGNQTDIYGGGIFARSSAVSLSNSTLSDNQADIYGGGIFASGSGVVNLSNSIVANSFREDCFIFYGSGSVNTDNATIIEDGSCGAVRSGDPGLLALANNGGATLTHALSPTSSALNSGIFSGAASVFKNCTSEDQRGEARDNGDRACDVGAFEANIQPTNFFVIPLSNGRAVVIPL